MMGWLDNLDDTIDSVSSGVEDLGNVLSKSKAAFDKMTSLLASLGFDLPNMKVERTTDGGWSVNGTIYPGTEQQFTGHLGDGHPTNAELPAWFPFGELVLQRAAADSLKAAGKDPQGLGVEALALCLCDWVKAGATSAEISALVGGDGSLGLPVAEPVAMTPEQLRAYWAGAGLIAAIQANASAPEFNARWDALAAAWREPTACFWSESSSGPAAEKLTATERANRAAHGLCVSVPINDNWEATSPTDANGKIASPTAGEWVPRARAILRFLATGELMSTAATAGSFQGFEACVRSGEESCLAGYTPQSPDFWTALREPWRFGYDASKKVQVVNNTFGKFLAWNIGGKPRGVSLSVVLAISLPSVVAIGTIAGLYFYAKGKTGGR